VAVADRKPIKNALVEYYHLVATGDKAPGKPRARLKRGRRVGDGGRWTGIFLFTVAVTKV